MFELVEFVNEIEVNGQSPMKICSRCMEDYLQQKQFWTLMIRATKFLAEEYGNPGELLPSIQWTKQYYISFYKDGIDIYHVKIM